MADKRINALTTTSASVGDDYFAIDGATNGTRALSAFSPTFGGNATVTGTLTVNGASTMNGALTLNINASTIGKSGSGNGGNWRFVSDDGTTRWLSGILGGAGETSFSIYDIANSRSLLTATAAGVVQINQTTASTTTSTGALVVGNGTSGGLGVGGAIYAGGSISSTAADGKIEVTGTGNTTGTKELIFKRSDNADTAVLGLTGSAYAGALTGLGNNEAFFYNSSASAFRVFLGTAATQRYDFTAGQFKINPTTASTSTSSGALVVSGGVGVAGAIYGGGDIISSGNGNIQGGRFTSVNSNSYIEQSGTDFTYVTGGSRPHVFSIGGTTRFQVTTSGIISSLPASAASLTANSTMTFELTSNTSLKIFVRGSDGTTRSTTLTLA